MTRRTAAPPSSPRRPAAGLAWQLVLCLLMSGVVPSVSRALAASAAPFPVDVCLAHPDRPGAPVDGRHGAPDAPACAMCAVHGGTHAAPPAAAPRIAEAADTVAASPSLAERPAVRAVVFAADPRGPPVTLVTLVTP